MKSIPAITLASAWAVLAGTPGSAAADVVDTRVLDETVSVAAGEPLVVVVKNITGSIRVTGHDADRVEMTATETVRGDLQADIDRARAAVELRTESEAGRVAFRVRRIGADDADCDCRWGHWDGYSVEYDIELRVPRTATLDLSTVNGDVAATFDRTPAQPTAFRTVNGDLDVTFPNNLAADLEFATLHGEVFTDFEVASLRPPPATQGNRDRGRFVMRMDRNSGFRVGAGGAKLSFNTVNGDIFVRKANP